MRRAGTCFKALGHTLSACKLEHSKVNPRVRGRAYDMIPRQWDKVGEPEEPTAGLDRPHHTPVNGSQFLSLFVC
jgi:hypothetical protein